MNAADDTLTDIQCQILALRQGLASIWANYLANSVADPIAEAQKAAGEASGSLLTVIERPNLSAPELAITEGMLKHTESLWLNVEQLLRQRSPGGTK